MYLKQQELYTYEKELKQELRGVLAGCSTVKQLITALPDIEQYCTLLKQEVHLPIVQTDKLKQLLNGSIMW